MNRRNAMQRHHPMPMYLVGFAAAALLAGAALDAAVAATPQHPPDRVPSDKWPADTLEFVGGGGRPARVPDAPGLLNSVKIAVVASVPGPTVRMSFSVEPTRDSPAGARWDHASFDYTLPKGSVVPMLGAVYTVTDASSDGDRAKLDRVADAELLKEIGVDPDSTAVPLGMPVYFAFGIGKGNPDHAAITVKRIAAPAAGKPAEAHITLEYSGTSYLRPPGLEEAVVTVGDDVRLPRGVKLEVRRIVPPDEKRKIVGWVELSPKPSDKPGKWVGHP
jgi:hypothetical protein